MPGEDTKATEGSSPNLGKKFVQTRLPFKILSPAAGNKADETRKRKPSSPVNDDRASKALKTTEENDAEQMDDSEYSNPDAIIVIHDEDSLEKVAKKDDEKKDGENDDVEDTKGILIKFPFVKKAKGEAKQEVPKKSAAKGRKKRSRKEEKSEETKDVEVVEIINESNDNNETADKIPQDGPSKEILEDDTKAPQADEQKPQEVVEPAADEKPSDDDKDSGKDDSEEDLEDQKSRDEEPELVMTCEEKLSRSSDGDNQSVALETPPRKKVKVCSTPTSTPSSSNEVEKKLTPKQLEKKQELERRREERLSEQINRKKKLEEEKELKRKEREEKEELRRKEREEKEELKRKEKEDKEEQKRKEKEEKEEQKRKERDEKDELKRKEKEEKEKKRVAEQEAKNEEKRLKDEEKRRKEDEKKEAARRASDNFKKFFMLKSKPSSTVPASDSDKENSSDAIKPSEPRFMPFCVKPDMRLAPNTRRILKKNEKSLLDSMLQETPQSDHELYLKDLRSQQHIPMKTGNSWVQEDDNDIILIDDAGQKIEEIKPTIKYRVKFLSFHENQRPPYYGTWSKKTIKLGPRNPFGKDDKHFDYEVDSDDEWEEEEPGESLHGSDDEKESEDDYEVDNDFFVPHGHLSDEELQNEDGADEDNSPEMQKAKLKLLQQEFANEMSKKTEKLQPRLIGCIWQNENGEKPDSCSEVIWRLLTASKMLFNGPIVIKKESPCCSPSKDEAAPESTKKRKKLPEEDVKNFIRLVHGNCNSGRFLVEEFQATLAGVDRLEVTKMSLKRKLREIAEWRVCPEAGTMMGKMCWYVSQDVRHKYGLHDLTLPNTWKYTLTPKRVEEPPAQQVAPAQKEVKKDSAPEQEKPTTKKRVALLMSVPCGQTFSPATKNKLISEFMKKGKVEEKPPAKKATSSEIIQID